MCELFLWLYLCGWLLVTLQKESEAHVPSGLIRNVYLCLDFKIHLLTIKPALEHLVSTYIWETKLSTKHSVTTPQDLQLSSPLHTLLLGVGQWSSVYPLLATLLPLTPVSGIVC